MSLTILAYHCRTASEVLKLWGRGMYFDTPEGDLVHRHMPIEDHIRPHGKLFVKLSDHHAFHISDPIGDPYIELPNGVKRYAKYTREDLDRLNAEALEKENERIRRLYR